MPTKEDVLAAMARLDATIHGLKQGWSGADVTRHIALDVGTLRKHIEARWEEDVRAAEQILAQAEEVAAASSRKGAPDAA